VSADTLNLKEVVFICREVELQGRGPHEVGCMASAWLFAKHTHTGLYSTPETVEQFIHTLGWLIEPTTNFKEHWRKGNVRIGYAPIQPPTPIQVPRLMQLYSEGFAKLSAEEAYLGFEQIHPLSDGNGRVGAILYNFKLGILEDPQMPPGYPGVK
jgi:hypothetical protein